MADDSNFRSYRPADPRWPAPAAPEAATKGGSDPLAELARLIGQTDPFAEPQRGAAPTPVRPAPIAAPPQAPVRRPVPSPSTASDPYGSPLHFSPREFPRR